MVEHESTLNPDHRNHLTRTAVPGGDAGELAEIEAAIVRRIFDRVAKTGSALAVARELNAAGAVTKRRVCATGVRGAKPWTKGAIYKVLANRVYLDEAVHKGVAHPGEHAAIIDQRTWDKAHAVMAEPAHPAALRPAPRCLRS